MPATGFRRSRPIRSAPPRRRYCLPAAGTPGSDGGRSEVAVVFCELLPLGAAMFDGAVGVMVLVVGVVGARVVVVGVVSGVVLGAGCAWRIKELSSSGVVGDAACVMVTVSVKLATVRLLVSVISMRATTWLAFVCAALLVWLLAGV